MIEKVFKMELLYIMEVAIFLLLMWGGYLLSSSRDNIMFLLFALAGLLAGEFFSFAWFEPFFIVTVVFLTFHLSAQFSFKEFDHLSKGAVYSGMIGVILSFIFFGTVAWFLIGKSTTNAAILVLAVLATDYFLGLGKKSRSVQLQKLESAFKSIIALTLFVFIVEAEMRADFAGFGAYFFSSSVIGLGLGLIMSLLYFRLSRRFTSFGYYLCTIIFSIVVFLLARFFEANGVLAVAVVGILFANLHLKGKKKLLKFSENASRNIIIPMFFFSALFVKIPLQPYFFIKTLLLFIIYIFIRFASFYIATKTLPIRTGERLHMALSNPHGGVAVLMLFALSDPSLAFGNLTAIIFLLMVYSLLVSLALDKFWRSGK